MIKRLPLLIFSALLALSACNYSTRKFFVEGVSIELAEYRAKFLSGIHYDLYFNIPEELSKPVTGKVTIKFRQRRALHGVILDFSPGEEFVHKLTVNGQLSDFTYVNQHILVPSNNLFPGENLIELEFTASDQALNRSEEFMYTLFVPDRASTAFPCFDQPDLKATFNLSLEIHPSWTALSNGPLIAEKTDESTRTLAFAMKNPISTYLFAFTAGKFQVIESEQNGRSITVFHRETDPDRLKLNTERIFRHHFESLAWLEEYTGIPYPYEKFAIALIPGFQYSGMEHPGAIWYRDDRLLLDENAPLMQLLRKASLIAHETAHMWFGNLVTMKWFDDVWLKEVFAGLMADKMIEPQFPEVNHNLQFFLSHFPRAYSIDRSRGTHPVKQLLANLNMAGMLYGPVIYNKAPIIFKQLEKIMGEEQFRTAVQDYLRTYSHANATWNDLVTIFDKYSPANITEWSNAWVYGSGMPQISYTVEKHAGADQMTLSITQENPIKPFQSQWLSTGLFNDSVTTFIESWLDKPHLYTPVQNNRSVPQIIVLNGGGLGYGYFKPTKGDREFVMNNTGSLNNENLRAAIYLNLYEDFLNKGIAFEDYVNQLHVSINGESNPQILNFLSNCLFTVTRNFSDPVMHSEIQLASQELIWNKLQTVEPESKQVLFDVWLALARNGQSLEQMKKMYSGELKIPDFRLSDQNMTKLACEIALRTDDSKEILELELKRIVNPDRKRRLEFISPALSANESERDSFFQSLKKPENRKPEPWVIDALNYLHHPLRLGSGEKYIAASLEMLEQIQETGDIFFPKDWLDATLGNYQNPKVAALVEQYLESHPDLAYNLRLKVLQSADLLFRRNSY